MTRLTADQTRVTFVIRRKTEFGQRLRIVGDHPALGGWDPLRAVELLTSNSDFPTWRLSVTLPANRHISYKYVCVTPSEPQPLAVPDPHSPPTGLNHVLAPAAAAAAAADANPNGPSAAADAQARPMPVSPAAPSTIDLPSPAPAPAFTPTSNGASPHANAVWEQFEDNRTLDTEPHASMVIDDGDFGTLNNDVPTRVTSVSHQVLSSRPSRESDLGYSGSVSPLSLPNDGESVIIAIYRLPVIAERDAATGTWSFSWDDDALYLTSTGLRRGLEQLSIKPLWVGVLNTPQPVPLKERDTVTRALRERFNCVPVFLPADVITKFYNRFCKGTLWRPFHMLTNVNDADDGKTVRFDQEAWHAYQRVNRTFSNIIVEHYERHLIWVHDYHLMLLPYYLRIKLSGVKIGFYLHIPWPSSELFRMLPVRKELLKGLLSATMLGFHLFDYARHFLSACVRLLNLEHEARRGSLGIDYEGRHVMIRVSHIGVDPERFSDRLGVPRVRQMAAHYEAKYPGKTLLGAIDDLDEIKGIALKLIAFENYLQSASETVRNSVALIQVAIPKAARVNSNVRAEIRELVDRINQQFGKADHVPVMYIEESISFDERIAIYSVCDALLLTPVRDGLNLIPYEYIVSTRQGKGQLILSEFTGCSRALSSAVRVNPWNIDEMRDVIDNVIQKRQARAAEIRLKHEADRKYVTTHSSALWAESFLRDLKEASESVQEVVRLGLSRAGGFRRLEFDEFTMLNSREVVKAYREAERKLFLFDYDGTITEINTESSNMAHSWARPSEEVLQNLELLSKQDGNTVVILSGRGTETDGFHLPVMKALGIAAEHGFYYKRPGTVDWEEVAPQADLSWLEIALRIMQLYTDRTDGSYIEEKSTGLVWHFLAADPEFGQWQAKEMHDHLESILTPFNVQVVNGHGWLQVRLANVNKGTMVEKILSELDGAPDFILCCGDDRTDEDMFSMLARNAETSHSQLFTTTVGVKPSNARYYLRSPADVSSLLEGIIEIALPGSATHVRSSTLEDMRPSALRRLTGEMERMTTSSSSGMLNFLGMSPVDQQ